MYLVEITYQSGPKTHRKDKWATAGKSRADAIETIQGIVQPFVYNGDIKIVNVKKLKPVACLESLVK